MSARWDKSASLGPVKRPRTGPGDPGLDPYVRWAMATEWNGFKRKGGRMAEPVRLIACAPDVEVLNSLLKPAAAAPSGVRPESLEIPAAYGQKLGDMGYQPLHFTATISRSDLISWLVPNPLRLRWRLALPLRDAGRAAQASSKGLYGPARDAASMTAKNLVADDIRSLENLQHPQELHGTIGLIDAGCPFLNQAFESGAGTRIAAIWDQGAQVRRSPAKHRKTGWPWIRPQNFGHGRELGPNALRVIAQAAHSSRRLEETQVYRGLDYLIDYEDQRRRVWYGTHGGHLLDMAAGRTDPLAPRAPADAAANANLVFVDLPLSTAMDSSGGSLAAHVLDGVRYILSVAKPGHPTVVNISYGAQAGPHDGSSLIERALDELLEHGPANFAIVLAAGNSRQLQGHARRTVRVDRSVLLRIDMPPGDTTDSFVEVWYQPPEQGELRARVRAPNRQWSPWVAPGREVALRSESVGQETVALLRHDLTVPNGDGAMLLMAVCPTAQPEDLACGLALAGFWELELCWQGTPSDTNAGVQVDAWIERDDPTRKSGNQRPQFVDQESDDDRFTLSSLATGARTLRVGGFNLATGLSAAYSALGPRGSGMPQLLAVCEEDEASPSVAAAATRSGELLRLNGTSVAAPALSRRLYNALAQHGPFTTDEAQEVALLLALSGADPYLKPVDGD